MNDEGDLAKRNIMDGDPFMASTPSWRFRSPETEPYMRSQSPGASSRGVSRGVPCVNPSLVQVYIGP